MSDNVNGKDSVASSDPLAAPTCPLCGAANGCMVASTGSFATPCWCADVRFDAATLARVPASQRRMACICRACAMAKPPVC